LVLLYDLYCCSLIATINFQAPWILPNKGTGSPIPLNPRDDSQCMLSADERRVERRTNLLIFQYFREFESARERDLEETERLRERET
jgi:hypothetical protein